MEALLYVDSKIQNNVSENREYNELKQSAFVIGYRLFSAVVLKFLYLMLKTEFMGPCM